MEKNTRYSSNIFKVLDSMKVSGWELSVILYPSGCHICLTEAHIGLGEKIY